MKRWREVEEWLAIKKN